MTNEELETTLQDIMITEIGVEMIREYEVKNDKTPDEELVKTALELANNNPVDMLVLYQILSFHRELP